MAIFIPRIFEIVLSAMRPRKKPVVVAVSALLVWGIYAGWTYQTHDCGPNSGKNFREDFSYMTSTIEHCGAGRFNCDARLPHWQQPIVVSIYSEGIEDSQIDLVQSITFRALGEIREVSSIKIVHKSQMEPNFFVYITNDLMAERLSLPDASTLRFQPGSFHRRAYDDQSCSGLLGMSHLSEIEPDEYQTILASGIFVHHSLEGADLESCIYEEVAGVVGLSNDPEGQPSLFSRGNYDIVDGQFRYSQRLLLMFQAIYQVSSGEHHDINAFCEAQVN